MSHTPGRWMAAAKPSSVVGWPVVATPSGRSICNVTQHDEAEANARLIAAAPDLLEALEHARHLMWEHGFSENDLQPIRAALSKATGA